MDGTDNSSNNNSEQKTTAGNERQHTVGAVNNLGVSYSGPLAPLEKALDGVIGKNAQYQLPADIKELLVKIAPWLSLIGGILGLLSAINMWRAAHYVNQLSEAFGVSEFAASPQLSTMFWLSLLMTIIFSVLALLAFPGLKAIKKTGWNLMFYSMIANLLFGILSIFYSGGDMGSFIAALLMSGIGFYILFQIRDRYSV